MSAPAGICYVDMDGVVVDFESGLARLTAAERIRYAGHYEDVPGIFARMDPMPGAIEAYRRLAAHWDTYLLSTPPWANPSAWADKRVWAEEHLGDVAAKRLILTHRKDLARGDVLIDDRTKHGAGDFPGRHLHFGTPACPDWAAALAILVP